MSEGRDTMSGYKKQYLLSVRYVRRTQRKGGYGKMGFITKDGQ